MNPSSTPVKEEYVSPACPPVTIQEDETDPDESNKTLTMKLYLNDESIELNTYLMLQIMELLTSHAMNPSQPIDTNIDLKNEDPTMQFGYVFDVDDTFLRSMFGDKTTKTIKQIVESKLMFTFINIACIGVIALEFTLGTDSVLFNVYCNTMFCFLCIPWLTLKHLLFNQIAFKLCIQSFDFWIKVGYGFTFSVADIFLAVHVNGYFTWNNVRECTQLWFTVLSISYISSFDAVSTTKTKKLVVCIFMALLFSWWSIEAQFLRTDEEDFKIMTSLSNGVNVVSMHSFMANSSRILAIFFWKQSYKTWRTKGRAVSIVKSPTISWTNANTTEQTLANLHDAVHKDTPPQETEIAAMDVINQSTVRTFDCTTDIDNDSDSTD